MKHIFYGINGEGLGHACRAMGVIEKLNDHTVDIFTYGKAYDFFIKNGYQHVHLINGINFAYDGNKIAPLKTIARTLNFLRNGLRPNIKLICDLAAQHKPEYWVTDYEPSTYWAARRTGNKITSIDNQHRFLYGKFNDLPFRYRAYCYGISWITRLLVPFADKVIISFFGHRQIKFSNPKKVNVINPIVRTNITLTGPSDDGFVLVYLRPSISDAVLEILSQSTQRFVIYGALDSSRKHKMKSENNFLFKELSPDFTDNLLRCNKVISTAGNQLISEALYLSKPILVIPENGQYEQLINGYYVEMVQIGQSCKLENLSIEVINDFLTNFQVENRDRVNGADEAVAILLGNENEDTDQSIHL